MKSLIKGIKTIIKAVKFLKKQDDMKKEAKTLAGQVTEVVKTFEAFTNCTKETLTKLEEVVK
jgi:hypothetical protein